MNIEVMPWPRSQSDRPRSHCRHRTDAPCSSARSISPVVAICREPSGRVTGQRCSRSAMTVALSENSTVRHGRPSIVWVAAMTGVGRPFPSTQSPTSSSPIVRHPSGVGTSVSRDSALPSIRATTSSGSSTHSSVRPRQNSPGWMTNDSSPGTTTSSVKPAGGVRRSMADARWLWNTRKESPRRRSTLAGCTSRGSHGSIRILPSSTSSRIVPSDRTETGGCAIGGKSASAAGSVDSQRCRNGRTVSAAGPLSRSGVALMVERPRLRPDASNPRRGRRR